MIGNDMTNKISNPFQNFNGFTAHRLIPLTKASDVELWCFLWFALTLKRPGLCGWLRPTQFKPRLDWVGSAAQVRRYCVDSAAQAFIHALVVASCAVYSTRFAALAVRGPRILRPTRLMFSQPMSLLVSHNLALSGRVKNVYRHLLHFLTLMFSNKVETDQYIFHLLFLRHKCADYLCHSLHRYACRYTGTLPFI